MQTVFSKKHTRSGRVLVKLCCLALLHSCLAGGAIGQEKQFYQDTKRGWFWYESPPPVAEEEQPSEPLPRPLPSLADYTTEQLWDMHPDEFQDLLMEFQKKAVQRPTEENVRDYLTMQDLARRKAAAYANVASYVLQKYTDLDLGRDYPVAAPGVIARVKMQKEEIAATIRDAAADHALLFFASQDCGYCREQRQILSYFTDRYGWQIKEIDIDALPGTAARFGIRITPSLLLIARNRPDYIPVASGVVALDELERALYRSIRLLGGQITPQEYSVYDFQKGGGLDPESVLKKRF